MAKAKQFVFLADCKKEEVTSFAETLSYKGRNFDVRSHIANWKRTGTLSELKRYLMYFCVALKYFCTRRRYEAIVGWQQFYALIFCFYCSLFSVKKPCTVVALNYTYKEKHGRLSKLYLWFMKRCMDARYLDYIHVPSAEYADIIHEQFSFPRERIIVTTFGINDHYDDLASLPAPDGYQRNGYALAIGRSNRDYDFLIKAWSDIDYPLVIISDTYKGSSDSQNIHILTNVAGAASHPWIANCALMIIPIDDGSICSGDTVLLTAMSLKRRIVVTVPSTLAEMYVQDQVDALLTPKDETQFQQVIQSALSGQYPGIGEQARLSFLAKFSRRSMGEQVSKALSGDH